MIDSYKANNIIKEYSGIRILHGINFEIKPGLIHGLFGHNGAGKSTLLKIMAGVEKQDEGELKIGDKILHLDSPKNALDNGIACVYQELRLISNLTIMENIFLGREVYNKFGLLDIKYMTDYTEKLLKEHNIKISSKEYIKNLTHPIKQIIEVIINLDRNSKFIILDEPTTALERKQSDELLKDVQTIVKEKNIGVAIVSHKIDEVLPYCDDISVLSAGRTILQAYNKNFSKQDIIDAIVGTHIEENNNNRKNLKDINYQTPYLEIKNLSTKNLNNININAYKGEILGLYGLVGSGRTSLCQTLYGIFPKINEGNIFIDGKNYKPKSPEYAISSGISYLTEDRKNLGIIPLMPTIRNTAITSLKNFKNIFGINYNKLHSKISSTLEKLQIKGDIYSPIKSLSGGNQQKALLGRIIEENSDIILLDEPTKGVDLGAKADIYDIIKSLSKMGKCIIIVSSEEEELVEVADRVLVFKSGYCKDIVLKDRDITLTNLRESVF